MFGQVITIVGMARDAKYGAVVITSNNDVYYLYKMETWNKEMLGKQVKVTGRLVERKPEHNLEGEMSAEITTPIKIIKRFKFEIVE